MASSQQLVLADRDALVNEIGNLNEIHSRLSLDLLTNRNFSVKELYKKATTRLRSILFVSGDSASQGMVSDSDRIHFTRGLFWPKLGMRVPNRISQSRHLDPNFRAI